MSDPMAPSIRCGDMVLAVPSDGIGFGAGTVVVFDAAQLRLGHLSLRRSQCRWHLPHPGDGNGRADLTPATADQVVGVRRLVVPVVGLPINWYSAGAWVHLVAWLTVLSLAVLATRYALLEGHDPWMNPEVWTYASD